jgi:hypothetical protein
MKKFLNENGWKFVRACMCGGSLREDFSHQDHPTVLVRIRETVNTFTIVKYEMMVAGPELQYKLIDTMKTLNLYVEN